MEFRPELIWFLAGLLLIVSEFMLPGIILVFFGLGAWLTALTAWLGLTPGWSSQMLMFGLSSLFMLLILRRRFRAKLSGYIGDDHGDEPNLDDPAGSEVLVLQAIPAGGTGSVEYKGASWRARSETSLAAGETAVIVQADGITLTVGPRR